MEGRRRKSITENCVDGELPSEFRFFRNPVTFEELDRILTSLLTTLEATTSQHGTLIRSTVPLVEFRTVLEDACGKPGSTNDRTVIRLPLCVDRIENAIEDIKIEVATNSIRFNFRFHPDPPELRHSLERLLKNLHNSMQISQKWGGKVVMVACSPKQSESKRFRPMTSGLARDGELKKESRTTTLSLDEYVDYLESWEEALKVNTLTEEQVLDHVRLTMLRKVPFSPFDLSLVVTANHIWLTSVASVKLLILTTLQKIEKATIQLARKDCDRCSLLGGTYGLAIADELKKISQCEKP